ncbi:filamentous hemagglutinin N-terminal domain-containing protein [Variovorax sp. EL159]|uniref:two-partner secretion domain-containing protein n=1 Tax=Variovorax sp. EL159 TaxID=1566270 RepID=UPI000883FDF4|nr:filamentous hemagglutinin N-terminal domain-containing protein [Variovorax sp. EL159]SCX74101.1 filamentous hemagglutinin [Variovorax sp. EL159]
MNRHLHRIVFNAARGMRMVVQETATSTGKGANRATTTAVGGALLAGAAALAPMLAGAVLAGMLTPTSVHAQIVGAPNVSPGLRPTVLVAPNGVPLINIATPSAAGVSRNVYNQFNVAPNGAILNNSRANVQTQLGGYVQGNPFLATGPARIILNEVNGGSPSQLRGYIEVGGQRAEVIIANPAGISVDGGGFINASRATLTTGTPQFNAIGGLDSFLVRGGTVTIDGAGLDARTTDYAAILARAVQANAGIWASELKVVTGANQISADHGQITPTSGTGAAPTFALDVAALGGMYANKINLIGTEAGLGVRNAGNIGAGVGGLVVTAAGRLENIGTLEGQRVELTTPGDIDNRGGTIRQTSTAGLTITAPVLSNTQGGVIGAEPASAATGSSGTGGSSGATNPGGTTPTSGGGTTTPSATDGSSAGTGGTFTPATYTPPAPGVITAGGTLSNDGGRIYAGGPITLNTPQVNNAGGTLSVASMAVSGPGFSNAGGTLSASNSFSANVGQLDNSGGKLNAGNLNIVTSGDLINVDGTLTSGTDANLTVGGKADNTRGVISATGALTASVAGAVNNTSGTLIANNNVALTAASLDNSKGSIQSAQAGVQVATSGPLINGSGGSIGAATDLNVQAGSLSNSGTIRGTNDTTLNVSGALANSSSITAGRNTTVTTGSLQGSSTGVLGAGVQGDGKLGGVGDLRVTASGALTANGANLAAGNATLQGASVDLSAGQTSAANIAITATQGNVVTGSKATVVTPGTLSVTANAQPGQTLVNDAGQLNAGQLKLSASNIANTNGGEIVQTGTGATTIATSGTLNNDGGRIASNGQDLALQANAITNSAGKVEHAGAGTLSIAGGSYSGANGRIIGNGVLNVAMSGGFVQDGGVIDVEQITIAAASLSNNGGQILQTGTNATALTVAGALENNGGGIVSNGAITVAAGSLANQNGVLRTANKADLSVTATAALDNGAKGVITAGGNGVVKAGALTNDAGSITAVGDLAVTVAGAATNARGSIAANGSSTLTAESLDNTQGTIASVKANLAITTFGTSVNAKGLMTAGGNTTLINGGLTNTGGTVSGTALSVNTNGQQLVNNTGVLAATTTANLQAGALSNDAGLIQSGGAMTIDTHGQALINSNAAGFATGLGGITSADTLTLTAGAVNNGSGYIGAKNALNASTQAFTNTGNGVVLGQSTVTLNANGANYDNSGGGQTQAVGDLTIATGGGTVDNTGALIRSLGTTTLNAASVTNANTQAQDQGIEGKNVGLNVGGLNNSKGSIRGDQDVTITSGGTADNTNGFVSAMGTLRIVDPNAASPATAPRTLNLLNTGGTLVANKGVELRLDQGTLGGKIQSGADLTINASKNITVAQDGALAAIGNLTLTSSGNISNAGKITSGKSTWVEANNLDIAATGQITSLGTTTAIAHDTLTNRGLIDGTTTLVMGSNTVTNIGTGRIYGDQLSIQAGTLNNIAETADGTTTAATIAARKRLDLGVGTLNNSDGALILSLGDVNIAGTLDANSQASGRASAINNHAATIQAQGQVNINTNTLANTNGGVTYTMVDSGTSTHVVQFALQTSPLQRYDAADVFLGVVDNPCAGLAFCNQKNSYGQNPEVWPSWKAVSGSELGSTPYRNIIIPKLTGYPIDKFGAYYLNPPRHSAERGGDPGYFYPATDPIWAAFGVAPPSVELPAYLHGLTQDQVTVGNMESHFLADGTVKFDHPLTQAEYDALPGFNAAHEALDAQTSKFMAAIVGKPPSMNIQYSPGPGGLTNAYTYWDYTETGSTPVLQSSAPGKILSGGAMNLNVASGLNDMSQIVAGGALNVHGGNIVNQGLTADAQLKQIGTTGTMVGAGDNARPVITPYNQTINTTVVLATGVQQGNTAVGANGTSIGGLNAGGNSGVVAQGSGALNANTRVSPIVQVPLAVTGSGNATGTQANAAGAANGASGTGTASGATPTVVRTTTPNLGVPSASLFRTQPDAGSRYLIATDPAFAQYRSWLSSDYLLNNLGQDPNNTLKRLGDGFYEQQLIDQQVAKLTGSRYLDGFGDDQTQYTALMNSGATFAQKYNLTVGVALTDAQMAQLTSDIVWLVKQTVTLPDGSTQQVLVPQVYVRARPGDIDGSGALLAGKSIDLNISGDLLNISGTIAGRQAVSLSADNIANLGGRITGDSVSAKANTDLMNIGGMIDGQSAVDLQAKRDITIASTTRTSTNAESGRSDTVLDRVAGVYVGNAGQPGAKLSIDAGRDLVLAGAIVSNQGTSTGGEKAGTTLQAGRDILLGTVTTASSESVQVAGYSRNESRQQQVGTQITAVGDIGLQAGRDLSAQAVHISSSQGNVVLEAKRDLTIVSGSQQTAFDNQLGDDKSQYYIKNQIQMGNAQSSVVMGAGDVTLRSGRDLTVEGGVLAAGADAKTQQAINDATQPVDTRRSGTGSVVAMGDGGTPRLNHDNSNIAGPSMPTRGTLTLDAGGDINLLASQNELSVNNKNEDGSSRNAKRDASATVSNGTQLSGGTVNIQAKGDINSQATEVNANTLNVTTPGQLNLLTAKDNVSVSQSGIDNDAWFVTGGDSGQKNDVTRYNQFNAKNVNLSAGSINAQLGGLDTPGALAQQPGMAWIGQLQNDPSLASKVDWQRVKEVHEQWDNTYVTLGPASKVIVALVVTVATGGTGLTATSGTTGTAVAGTGAATSSLGQVLANSLGISSMGTVMEAGLVSMISTASVSLVENDGNIGKVLKELGSSASIKSILSGMLTAGAIQGVGTLLPEGVANASIAAGSSPTQLLGRYVSQAVAGAVVNNAVYGGSLGDSLEAAIKTGFINTGAALAAGQIGALMPSLSDSPTLNAFAANVAHAIAGCVAGAARAGVSGGSGSDGCSAGALGAVVGHLVAGAFNPNNDQSLATQTIAIANLMGGIAGAVVGNPDGSGASIGAQAGGNAAENNYLSHPQEDAFKKALAACAPGDTTCVRAETAKWQVVDRQQTADAENCITGRVCATVAREAWTGTGFTQKQTADLCQGEPTCITFTQSLARTDSNDAFTAGGRAASVPREKVLQDLAARGMSPEYAKMWSEVQPADIAGAGLHLAGAVTGSGGGSGRTTARPTGSAGSTGDDLPPGFSRGSGGKGPVIGDIDPVTGEVVPNGSAGSLGSGATAPRLPTLGPIKTPGETENFPTILLPDPPIGSGPRPPNGSGIGFDGYTPPTSSTPNAVGTVRAGNSSLDIHLIDEGTNAYSGSGKNLYGTHDQSAFNIALNVNGGIVVSSTKVAGTDGIYEVQYQLPGKNVATKTVFDPAVYSPADMAKMAQSASQSAINQYVTSGAAGQATIIVRVGGLQWRVGVGPGSSGVPDVKTAYPIGAASWP